MADARSDQPPPSSSDSSISDSVEKTPPHQRTESLNLAKQHMRDLHSSSPQLAGVTSLRSHFLRSKSVSLILIYHRKTALFFMTYDTLETYCMKSETVASRLSPHCLPPVNKNSFQCNDWIEKRLGPLSSDIPSSLFFPFFSNTYPVSANKCASQIPRPPHSLMLSHEIFHLFLSFSTIQADRQADQACS